MFLKKSNIYVSGLEIDTTCIRFVTINKLKGVWQVHTQLETDLPEGLITPSFNKKNIQSSSEFKDILIKLRKSISIVNPAIGISLPTESVRFVVKSFTNLPEEDQKIKDMILWNLAKTSKVDCANIDVKWNIFNSKGDSFLVLLIGMVSRNVLHEYLDVFKDSYFIPRYISSSDINMFNFYASVIPEIGIYAWLGIFKDSISIFVVNNSCPLFYKNVRKKLIAQNDADNIDMLLQYFMDEHPNLTIEKYYLSITPSYFEKNYSKTIFKSNDYEFLSPVNQIQIDRNNFENRWDFTAAAGAAWSTLIE